MLLLSPFTDECGCMFVSVNIMKELWKDAQDIDHGCLWGVQLILGRFGFHYALFYTGF